MTAQPVRRVQLANIRTAITVRALIAIRIVPARTVCARRAIRANSPIPTIRSASDAAMTSTAQMARRARTARTVKPSTLTNQGATVAGEGRYNDRSFDSRIGVCGYIIVAAASNHSVFICLHHSATIGLH